MMTGPTVQSSWAISADEPIDLTKLAEMIDTARDDGYPMIVASSKNDDPDIAFKGSVMVWDRDHLAYWERGLRETYEAVKANPRIALVVRNLKRDRRNVRLYGVCTVVEDPALREAVWERVVESEKASDPEKKGVAVLVRIDRVRSGGVTQVRRP